MQNENLAFAALQRAFRHPGAAAFEVSRHTIPYRRFADLLMYFAQRMRASGVDRRSTVGLAIKDASTAAIAASAVALLGSKWVPVSADSTAVFPGVTHVFGTPQRTRHPGRIDIDRSWFEAPVAAESALNEFPGYERPEDVWMIAHSSGTTGKPKFMPISYATVWRRMQNPELQDGVPPITCNLFPATSYVGAKINIGNLVLGGTNVARAPWDELVTKGVNRVMGSPAQIAAAIFSQNPAGGRIRSCKVTGAQVTAQFVEPRCAISKSCMCSTV